MPRYFIDTTDGDFYARDEEGSELPDLEAARYEAVTALPEMAQYSLIAGDQKSFCVKIRDDKGAVLFQAALTLSEQWMVTPPV